jgi:2-dehydro-3-deoxyphosphogluconate aldolase/(4S)-4-hydroxy-2-oxoglutarate aldolase
MQSLYYYFIRFMYGRVQKILDTMWKDSENRFLLNLKSSPLVMIFRGLKAEECLEITQALAEVGVNYFEVTMNTPDAIQIIKFLRKNTNNNVYIGAGTVLTSEQVRQVSEIGGSFIVSPNTNKDVIKTTKRLGMYSIPGAFTSTEIIKAWEYGADIVKVFPVNVVGSQYIEQLRGPIQHIPFMATGGIRIDMVEDLIRSGANSIGLGIQLLGKELLENRDIKGLQLMAKQFLAATRYLEEGEV